MVDDYTPTTDEVFDATLYTWLDWHVKFPNRQAAREGFDRWLAALRAEWEAEHGEVEWEYGYELIESDTRDVLTRSGAFDNEPAARHWARVGHQNESDPEFPPLDILIVRRRKAGLWLPVPDTTENEGH